MMALLWLAAAAGGQVFEGGPAGVKSDAAQIFPPAAINASAVRQWRTSVEAWRAAVLAQLRYNGTVYGVPELEWTQTSYVQPQMHPYDRFLWDPVARNWTVGRYLDDLRSRYGGIDSVLVWPTYTNIGADERNQFAMIRALPGGVAGIRSLAEQFHSAGVRMLVPYHVWDVGTRRELCPSAQPGCNSTGQLMDDWDAMAALLAATDVDGFNGDAEPVVTKPFYTAAMARHHPLAFEPESEAGDNPLTVIEWDTLSWGEHWTFATGPPVVDAKKFLTHGKHNALITSRWTVNTRPLAGLLTGLCSSHCCRVSAQHRHDDGDGLVQRRRDLLVGKRLVGLRVLLFLCSSLTRPVCVLVNMQGDMGRQDTARSAADPCARSDAPLRWRPRTRRRGSRRPREQPLSAPLSAVGALRADRDVRQRHSGPGLR